MYIGTGQERRFTCEQKDVQWASVWVDDHASSNQKKRSKFGDKEKGRAVFCHVDFEVTAIVLRPSSLPYKEENFQRLMSTAEGSW